MTYMLLQNLVSQAVSLHHIRLVRLSSTLLLAMLLVRSRPINDCLLPFLLLLLPLLQRRPNPAAPC